MIPQRTDLDDLVELEKAKPVIGLDLGKRRVAIGWPFWKYSAACDFEGYGWDRQLELHSLGHFVEQRIPGAVHLWAEIPYLSGGVASNPTTTADLAMSLGAILGHQRYAKVELVNPSSWKAALIGNHRATKDEIKAWLKERAPSLFAKTDGEENAVDGMCIGIYGIMREMGLVAPPKPKPTRKRAPRATQATQATGPSGATRQPRRRGAAAEGPGAPAQ